MGWFEGEIGNPGVCRNDIVDVVLLQLLVYARMLTYPRFDCDGAD